MSRIVSLCLTSSVTRIFFPLTSPIRRKTFFISASLNSSEIFCPAGFFSVFTCTSGTEGEDFISPTEGHDSSYKQEDGLRYNGRDVAVVRGKFLNCPVILGSATPALESYENCRHGRYQLLEMTCRVEQRPLPTIEAIDLRRQFRVQARQANAKQSTATTNVNDTDSQLITEPFANALKENLQAGHQTLIFLNRRGFANFLQCTSCGYVWRCPYCSVTLTLHLRLKRISCHHCDYRRPTTDICPQCHNPTLTGIGSGTERIEQALKGFVPQARVARMDRDTTTKRGSHGADDDCVSRLRRPGFYSRRAAQDRGGQKTDRSKSISDLGRSRRWDQNRQH